MTIECAFHGFLPSEPGELRESRAGKPYLRFRVGAGTGDAVQWLSVTAFGDAAQELADKLEKGSKVYVEGRLTLDQWEHEGRLRHGLSVAAFRVVLLNQIGRRRPKQRRAGQGEGGRHPAPAVASGHDPDLNDAPF